VILLEADWLHLHADRLDVLAKKYKSGETFCAHRDQNPAAG
jgi:hypothetical protein